MRGATADVEEDQAEMFPELDGDNAKHKELMRLAKRFAKAKTERDELLTTAKSKVDAAEEKLIDAMHDIKFTKFRHQGVTVEIIEKREKAQVKIDTGDEDEGDDE